LEENGYIKPISGYWYIDENGHGMVELHVDTCHIFEERANDGTKFGEALQKSRHFLNHHL
jgi:hypothetical protein